MNSFVDQLYRYLFASFHELYLYYQKKKHIERLSMNYTCNDYSRKCNHRINLNEFYRNKHRNVILVSVRSIACQTEYYPLVFADNSLHSERTECKTLFLNIWK